MRKFAIWTTAITLGFLSFFVPVCLAQAPVAPAVSTGQIYTCTCGQNCIELVAPTEPAMSVDPNEGAMSLPDQSCPDTCIIGTLGSKCPVGSLTKCRTKDCVDLENPLNIKDSQITAPYILGNVIKGFLSIIGSLALLMIVWGGVQWLTSMGNPEKVKAGANTMLWATIGLVLVFSSYLLVVNLLSYLQPAK